MNRAAEVALRHHCRLSVETMHPRFASVDRDRTFTVVLTLNAVMMGVLKDQFALIPLALVAGMGGTALSAFFTPRFVIWFGYVSAHVIIAVALALTALLVWTRMRDSPAWHPNTGAVLPKLTAAAKLGITWQMAFLYAVVFGGFVAFSTYLPTYLKTIYDFSLTDAGARTAGFAIAAVIARPIGGVLSDRIHPKSVVMISLAGTAVMAALVVLQPAPEIAAGATFIAMAFFLGIGTGGVFAWVALSSPPDRVGAVTGIVGAAGGLGGFFPPLVMGATYDSADNNYTTGLALLSLVSLLALLYTAWRLPGRSRAPAKSPITT